MGRNVASSGVKLPHHGSRHECKASVLEAAFEGEDNPIAVISANGKSHPHNETLSTLESLGVMPYCTNLAIQCGANVRQLISDPSIDPELQKHLNLLASGPNLTKTQPCQGDITIEIDNDGKIAVTTEFDLPCPYRGGYDFALVSE